MAFRHPEVFCVPTGLLGGGSLPEGLEWCYDVGAVHNPGVEISYTVVHIVGGGRPVGCECVVPFGFCDLVSAEVWGTVGREVCGVEMLKWTL